MQLKKTWKMKGDKMFEEKVIQSRNLRIWDYKNKVYLAKAGSKFLKSIDLNRYEVEEYLGEDSKGNAVYSRDFVVSNDDPNDKMVLFRENGVNRAMDLGIRGIENGEGRRYRINLPYLLRHFHKIGNSHNPQDRR